ncbi:MAG: hypothetical protein H7Z42_14095 [Roseiflexaceae bacterium]|nr:hypothetical protein [Roseiflexaceae bacterium]
MKIAFVALPRQEDIHTSRIAPPLPLAYLAAMLEQRRHIVRVYDLALAQGAPLGAALAPLRSFRPHLVVIATDSPEHSAPCEAALGDLAAPVFCLGAAMRDGSIAQAVTQALWHAGRDATRADEQSIIFEAMLALDDDIDSMPYPARHLLSLEQYPLLTLDGELQTTVFVGQQISSTYLAARNPAQITAEIQSVVREHGIRHFVFSGAALTNDTRWMHELLRLLASNGMGATWEATVDYAQMTPALAGELKKAGCEAISFSLLAGEVLVSREKRAVLSASAECLHEAGLGVRAAIQLDPPYSMMPSLIDVSATLGLDSVQFSVLPNVAADARVTPNSVSLEEIAEMARIRYRSSRSRQFFIDRFGTQFGPMLWRVGRAGLLGRTWQRYADGGDERALAF